MKVVEHAQDSFWRTPKLIAKRGPLVRRRLADPHFVLLRELHVGLGVVSGDVIGRYAGQVEQHRGDQACAVLAGKAVKQDAAFRLGYTLEDVAKGLSPFLDDHQVALEHAPGLAELV